MSNEYYVSSGTPSTGAFAASAPMRSEFGSVEDGFDLLPTLSGNGSKAVVVDPTGTELITTTGTLTLAGNFATSGASTLTLTTTGTTNVTLPTTGTLATLAGSEILTNKTISGSSNTLSNIGNASLTNSSITVNGTSIDLGDTATITAAAGTLTGATLAAGVTASSLTSVGTLTSLTVSGALTYGGVALTAAVTGTGKMVLDTSPTLVTPILGTPTSGTLTNCTLPVGGVSGLGSGVATFLATPTSANLAAAVTNETGSGALVFATSPTFTTPVLGAATATSLTVSTNTAAPLIVYRPSASSNVSVELRNDTASWFVGQGSGGDFNVDTDSTIGASPRLALTTDGNLSVTGSVNKVTITAPASGATLTIADGNTLSFEQGTFTPVATFAVPGDLSVSYATQTASYTKIGSWVLYNISLTFTPTHTTASGAFAITGLPLTPGVNANGVVNASSNLTWSASATTIIAVVVSGTASVNLRGLSSAGASTTLTTTSMPSGAQQVITISGMFKV